MFNCPICVEDRAAVNPLIYCYLSSANPPAQTYNHGVYLMMAKETGMFGAFKIIHIQLCVKQAGRRHTVDCRFIDLLLPALSEPTTTPPLIRHCVTLP